MIVKKPEDLFSLLPVLKKAWSPETIQPGKKFHPEYPAIGQSDVTAMLAQYLCGGVVMRGEIPNHGLHHWNWFEGKVFDLIQLQVGSPHKTTQLIGGQIFTASDEGDLSKDVRRRTEILKRKLFDELVKDKLSAQTF